MPASRGAFAAQAVPELAGHEVDLKREGLSRLGRCESRTGSLVEAGRQRWFEVRASRLVRASAREIFRTYVDYAGWTRWAGFGRVMVERAGSSADYGTGCIRVLNADGRRGREEILEAVPDARVVYRVIEGLPVTNHRADVTLSPREEALTEVTWTARFMAGRWQGSLLRLALTAVFWRTLRRLDLETRRRSALRPPGSGTTRSRSAQFETP
ncbi:MAG TPA: SRPBCC family protein [Polyangiaceae bacterium]